MLHHIRAGLGLPTMPEPQTPDSPDPRCPVAIPPGIAREPPELEVAWGQLAFWTPLWTSGLEEKSPSVLHRVWN